MLSISDPGFLGSLRLYAEGGDTSVYTDPSGVRWRVHRFASTGTLTVVLGAGDADYLVAAGGGGGAVGGGGEGVGGGGGGAVFVGSQRLTPGTYAVSVGAGGASGADGVDSSFAGVPVQGGGGGGGRSGRQGGGAGRGAKGGGGAGGPKPDAGGQSGYNGGYGSGNVNSPGGSGGGARGVGGNASGGVIFDPFPTVVGDNGVVRPGGIGYYLGDLFGRDEGIGGGGAGGRYYASTVIFTGEWGGSLGTAPANRAGGGSGYPNRGNGGSGVVYVRYKL